MATNESKDTFYSQIKMGPEGEFIVTIFDEYQNVIKITEFTCIKETVRHILIWSE